MDLRLQEERRHLGDLRRRQANRLAEAGRAAMLALNPPEVVGVAAVVLGDAPATVPGRSGEVPMRRSDDVEEAAMACAAAYEKARGWRVEDVSAEDRGCDLLSRGPGRSVRYIEVKGRAWVGAVELSANECLKAEQLGSGHWLYIVTDALQKPVLNLVQDPANRLSGEEVIPQERYRVPREGWSRAADTPAAFRAGGKSEQEESPE